MADIGNIERQPLLDGETSPRWNCEYVGSKIFDSFFYFLCYISGQLMLTLEKENPIYRVALFIISIFVSIIFFTLNVGSLVFDLYAVVYCPFPNCGFIAGPYIESKDAGGITANDTPTNGNLHDTLYTSSPVVDHAYFSFQDAVITVATVSGSLSYLIMMFRVLIVNYSILSEHLKSWHTESVTWCIRNCNVQTVDVEAFRKERKEKSKIINPFLLDEQPEGGNEGENEGENEGGNTFLPVELNAKQLLCFHTILILNLLLYVGAFITLFHIVHVEIDSKFPRWKVRDYLGLISQLASQYCAIISCFIFSRVAYAVTWKCHKQLEKYQQIYKREERKERLDENGLLKSLEKSDSEYVQLCNATMRPYRLWFSVHWFLYALTAFMSVAYLVDTVADYKHDVKHRFIVMLYVFFFTLEHLVLFMYPCFRAASLLDARNTLIYRVSREEWQPNIKSKFLQFMKEQKCGFVLSLICIRVEFGFNVAYLSIFFGFLGLVIKVFALN